MFAEGCKSSVRDCGKATILYVALQFKLSFRENYKHSCIRRGCLGQFWPRDSGETVGDLASFVVFAVGCDDSAIQGPTTI